MRESEEAAAEFADALRQLLEAEAEKYRQRGDEVKAELLANGQAVSAGRAAVSFSRSVMPSAMISARTASAPS